MSKSHLQEYISQGWEFSYCPETRFVEASHPEGGKQSVCELGGLFHRKGFGEVMCAALTASQWRPIETAPTREDQNYMILCKIGDDQVAVEVSNFEGNRYPNRHDANVDFEDRIENATHWMPCASLPNR